MKRLTNAEVRVDASMDRYLGPLSVLEGMKPKLLNMILNGPTINGVSKDVLRQIIRQLYSELAAYEDTRLTPEEVDKLVKDWTDLCTIVGECSGISRVRELAEADKDGRVVVLPFTSGRTLLCKENIDSLRLMKDVELAIRYCSSCGIVFHMGYNLFCDLVKHGRITAVSEEAEKALEAKRNE